LGRFEAWTFCILDVLELGCFEAWDVLRLWTFCILDVLELGRFEAGTRVRRSYAVRSKYKRIFIRFEANKMALFTCFASKRNEFRPEANFRFKRIFEAK
jgi:hypothetical protein